MTFYAGDEYADDEVTSGPYDPELHDARSPWPDDLDPNAFDAERQAIEDEYDREQSR